MRTTIQLLFLTAVGLSGWVAPIAVQAQGVPRYNPASPTLSPYLNLLQNNRGPLPSYFSLVRPIQRQQQINQRAAVELQQQAIEIERAQAEFGQREITPTGKAGWFYNQSPRNQFNQRSHYFGQWPQPPAAQGSVGRGGRR